MVDTLATLHRAVVDAGDRLDKFLARSTGLSRMRLKGLIEAGQATIDGATINDASARVKPGQAITLGVPPNAPARPQAQEIPLTIVYEDVDLIVIDKPAGLVVHPAPGNPDNTLVNALLAHCRGALSGIGGVERPGIVHRIDKDTSGLLVVAKSEVAHHGLGELFSRHDIDRGYKAVVWGNPKGKAGVVEAPIGRARFDRKKMAVVADGKPAITHWTVEARFGTPPIAALIDCRLETGRTHQIRVHMASLGHGLVGDKTYGRAPKGAPGMAVKFPRQALHAWLLGFRHPVTGKSLAFESNLPSDLNELLDSLESI
ncbi:RluA family pseudouridine synthase [Oleomonas cavernae]|uniref:Pseudouridine synthase n=1 Tax=Oleomonas cavernae TaxID=2320859 RepID=A0A418WGT8_9PROT|nr:RluA family pseudouridine synthase [Oleomonas cavernae]RJF89190.1 RluA family pseudouridine synthase [Oleomonas cavernae]